MDLKPEVISRQGKPSSPLAGRSAVAQQVGGKTHVEPVVAESIFRGDCLVKRNRSRMAFIQRTGQDTSLRSDHLPAIAIQIDPEFKYVGSTTFILYDVAHAEQHHFVVSNAERRIVRRLWFQFEGYLDDNNHTYDYSGMDTLRLNGFTFLHNTYPMNIEDAYEAHPTSDTAHAVDFLKEKGYRLTGDIMSHRMIWLDAGRRNELMIIYSEVLDSTGYRLSDIVEGGSAAAEWPTLSRELQERSRTSFKIL